MEEVRECESDCECEPKDCAVDENVPESGEESGG